MDDLADKIPTNIKNPLVIPQNGIPLMLDNGVYKVIKKEGTGNETPKQGSKVTVHYTGKLTDGTVFDSSRDRETKFTFNLGKGEVIKAWDVGIASMKRNEICIIHCAPEYGYGIRGSPPKIPKNAELIFEVELFDWEGEDLSEEKDRSIIREVLTDGVDYITPNDGASVEVKLVGRLNKKVFDDRQIKYNVSEADDELNLIPAIDIAVKAMKRKEHCRIFVKSKHGFGSKGCETFHVPPDSDLVYNITLLNFENAKDAWEMTDEERIEQSLIVKEKGTGFLKEGKVKKALIQYKKIMNYLEYHDVKDTSEKAEDVDLLKRWDATKLAGSLNIALCHNKLKAYAEAIKSCEDALKIDPQNEKAIYRIGEATFAQKMFDEAKEHFAEVAKINPGNKSARQMMAKCSAEIKRVSDAEKMKFKGMFDKFSKEDEEAEIKKKVEQQKERARAKAAKKEALNGGEKGEPPTAPANA